MSGRVGDLSPKQEEALAKVSLLLARLWPSPLAASGCEERSLRAGDRSPLAWLVRRGRFSLSLRTSGSLVVAISSTSSPGGAPWEAVVAWKPSEAAEGTKATFILAAARDWQQSCGTGAGPQASSHFREVFLLRGQPAAAYGWVPDSSLANSP